MMTAIVRWAKRRIGWLEWWSGRENQTTFLLHAVFFGFGIVFTVTCLPFYRHYLLSVFPMTMIWAAKLALPMEMSDRAISIARRLLLVLCLANAGITAGFLAYIHAHGGAPTGGFGVSYAAQTSK